MNLLLALFLLGVFALSAFVLGWALGSWWSVRQERKRWWTWMKPTFSIREDEKPDWLK